MLQPTYDILNCGPRQRFVANGKLVHNSEKLNLQNLGRNSGLRRALVAPEGQLTYVADSAQIEARMNNWNAGQQDMVDAFARNEDIYSKFAGEHVYHMPVNKNDNPMERFVGKVSILGLGYGMGAKKFQTTLAVGAMGPEVMLAFDEAQFVVQAYRKAHYMIARYWKECEIKLLQMLNPNCDEPWGVLHLYHNMIVLPNGMALQYPGLQAQEDPRSGRISFQFHNGRYWKDVWGGVITENIVQALARIVLFEQMLKANDYAKRHDPSGRVVLNVHDEIVAVASDFGARKSSDGHWTNTSEADEFYQGFEDILRERPPWAPDLPLDAEGGYDTSYSK